MLGASGRRGAGHTGSGARGDGRHREPGRVSQRKDPGGGAGVCYVAKWGTQFLVRVGGQCVRRNRGIMESQAVGCGRDRGEDKGDRRPSPVLPPPLNPPPPPRRQEKVLKPRGQPGRVSVQGQGRGDGGGSGE